LRRDGSSARARVWIGDAAVSHFSLTIIIGNPARAHVVSLMSMYAPRFAGDVRGERMFLVEDRPSLPRL
jgi:hypothetical protein